ncbi:cysteine desulfurase-like protein [Salaquimonas pukyongi]|uniref:cysteine desulfurase-like protein n=1 Tax=Salaquimonas pukyongi TaxID=2712698 RepID=UPI00096BBB07|nr:cysteine desulfurase-like protein [Salaquimonas pukyongi]
MTAFPLEAVRARFPSLATKDGASRRIYLDNPAGTQVPRSVADAIGDAILNKNANLGGDFPTSRAAGSIIERGHGAMADFLGCDEDEVIIGPNMTSLTYHFSRMIGRGLKPGDEIIVTQMDHEGNVSPWLQLADDLGLNIRKVPFSTGSWTVEEDVLKAAITDRTRVLALNYSSNLTGATNAVGELVAIAKAAGILTYVDAVQFAPHGLCDVGALDCDFLVCSAYKFFGPHLGILYGRRSVLEKLDAYKCRCSDNALPYRFETGTPQIELVAGLEATVDYIAWLGGECGEDGRRRQKIAAAYSASIAHENALCGELIDGLLQVDDLTVYGITDKARFSERVPTVSFTLADISPQELVNRLNEEGIFCWAGHNYAWEVVHQLGIDPDQGVVRIGIANYNTAEEIAETVEAVQRNVRMLRQG